MVSNKRDIALWLSSSGSGNLVSEAVTVHVKKFFAALQEGDRLLVRIYKEQKDNLPNARIEILPRKGNQ